MVTAVATRAMIVTVMTHVQTMSIMEGDIPSPIAPTVLGIRVLAILARAILMVVTQLEHPPEACRVLL